MARLEARDIIALVIVVGTLVALILRAISPEQAITVIMAILAYYFGYGYGYERGVSSARREKVA